MGERFTAQTQNLEARLATALNDGRVVAFPTETFYGLGVRLDRALGLARLIELKGRTDAIPLIAATREMALQLGTIEGPLVRLAEAFWPGPLTLVVPPRRVLPQEILGPAGTLALRVTSSPWAALVARAAGGVVTATSANRRGQKPPNSADAVDPALWDDGVLVDGGGTPGGAPSTVVGLGPRGVVVYRDGAITQEMLFAQVGPLAWPGP